jgi:hypothetical protein
MAYGVTVQEFLNCVPGMCFGRPAYSCVIVYESKG